MPTRLCYNPRMFEPIEVKPRGFLGRPLIAIVFAAVLGGAASEVASRLQVSDHAVIAIIIVLTIVVGYGWEWLDSPRA